MKKSWLVLILFFFHNNLFSQGEFNNWYFGWSAGVCFNSGFPVPLANGAAIYANTSVSLSDSAGNFLFTSNGINVYNRNMEVMPHGYGLHSQGGSGHQDLCAVQKLEDDSSYYLFTTGPYDPIGFSSYGLLYSIINMRLDSGMGDVDWTQKNVPVPGASKVYSGITATRHKNNRDAWVVARLSDPDSNYFASYKITASGLNLTPVYSPCQIFYNAATSLPDEIIISPDGNKLFSSFMNPDTAEYCQFNTSTGQVTPFFKFIPGQFSFYPSLAQSAEFSTDSKFLYLVCNSWYLLDHCIIYQYEADKTDSLEFVQNETIIGIGPFNSVLQMGPEGKIYGTQNQSDSLFVINNPSVKGTGCNLQFNAIPLSGNDPGLSLPVFLQRYYVYPHSTGHCQGKPVHFSMTVWPPADSVWWSFGDPGSGAANISNELEPVHVYNSPGSYNVQLIVRHNDKRFDTAWLALEIRETPQPLLGPDQTICQGDSVTLDAGFCIGCTYEWTSIPPGFSSTTQTVTINQSGVYTIAVTTTDGCTGRDTMQLSLTIPPVVTNSPLSTSICSGESTSILLSSTIPGSTFYWTAIGSSHQVSGYSAGTGDTIDQALTNTGPIAETVTYTVTPAVGECEGDSVQYVVTVTPGDSVNISISASVDSICDGTTVTFNATTINGGAALAFQWIVNGLNQGTNDSIFTYAPDNGDSIRCVLTSSNTSCTANNPAASNAIRMTVYPDLPVIISISTTNDPVCEGSTAIFTASTANKGTLPNFQWFVNGNPVGTNDSIFAYIPSNGDQVYCVLTSSEQCTTNNPATSNTVILVVNPLLTVGINISASINPVCEGIPVTFTGAAINGGSTPLYQWLVNGANAGMNNAVFIYIPENGDAVSCTLTSSEPCAASNPATSNEVSVTVVESPEVTFTPCFDTTTTTNAKPIRLRGGIPLGGIYSGPGVTGSTGGTGWTFDPALAGAGIHEITYNYINEAGCQDSAKISVLNSQFSILNCGDSLTDIRDNKKYPTIQIGAQCWMAANLNYGTIIPLSTAQRDNCIPEKYLQPPPGLPHSGEGSVYQWDELMQYDDVDEVQGLCPPGWHIPSESDWNQLFSFYQNSAFAGAPLKYTGYSGFNALLTGAGFFNSNWFLPDFATFFWSSTSHGPYKAWAHGMNETNYSVSYYPSFRSNAFSVRCIRD